MNREFRDFLDDMLEYAEKASAFVEGMTQDQFLADEKTQFAVIRALEVIGEAARHVPTEFRDRFTAVPWARIVGMRHVLAHDYGGADPRIVYDTVTIFVPELIAALPGVIAQADQ